MDIELEKEIYLFTHLLSFVCCSKYNEDINNSKQLAIIGLSLLSRYLKPNLIIKEVINDTSTPYLTNFLVEVNIINKPGNPIPDTLDSIIQKLVNYIIANFLKDFISPEFIMMEKILNKYQ